MKKMIIALGGIGVVAVLAVWMTGALGLRIAPDSQVGVLGEQVPEITTVARTVLLPEVHEAVGTVRPRTEIRVEAQVPARVVKVLVRPGQSVKSGERLIELDDREFEARTARAGQFLQSARVAGQQSRNQVDSAKAEADKAKSTYERMQKLHKKGAIAAEELEVAERNFRQTQAGLTLAREGVARAGAEIEQARKALEESRINTGYTEINAPDDGVVVKRMVEPGDLAVPGKPLLVMQAGARFWLEALVREGLVYRIRVGRKLEVSIPALGENVTGVVEEVVPSADTQTRTFIVRVSLPQLEGLYQGMFGRLGIALDKRPTILVPPQVVRKVGQLETVRVQTPAGWRTVYVRTGRRLKDGVEILSGLSGGEVVGADLPDAAANVEGEQQSAISASRTQGAHS